LMAAMALAHILILSGITQCRHNSVDGTDTHNHISLATLVMFLLFVCTAEQTNIRKSAACFLSASIALFFFLRSVNQCAWRK
jgi:hypothetical protein